jgi:hypothetical protein
MRVALWYCGPSVDSKLQKKTIFGFFGSDADELFFSSSSPSVLRKPAARRPDTDSWTVYFEGTRHWSSRRVGNFIVESQRKLHVRLLQADDTESFSSTSEDPFNPLRRSKYSDFCPMANKSTPKNTAKRTPTSSTNRVKGGKN